jgi:catechol 2,3-dioxygenase-like lactoylglutathione lyase family enzyme
MCRVGACGVHATAATGEVGFAVQIRSTDQGAAPASDTILAIRRTESVMAITSFEIVSIPVADQERSKVFYRDISGFTLLREESMGPRGKWIQLAPPGCPTTIALVTWFESMKPGALQGVMLNSTDIEGDHHLFSSRGLQLSAIEQQPWGRYSMFTDPDGNGWILRQPPPAA